MYKKEVLKILFSSFLIGIYFLTVTPIHMYTHLIAETKKDIPQQNGEPLKKCHYLNYVNTSGEFDFTSTPQYICESWIPCFYNNQLITENTAFIDSYILSNTSRRAPPSLV